MLDKIIDKLSFLSRNNDLILAIAIVSIIALLVIPLKPFILDTLICLSIVLSVTTLLVTLYTEDPLSFSSFPSLLLFMTLYRLGLNIASTRMILTEAQAGEIIKTFGEFVTGGSQLVGFVLFTLLTGINFIVITKGSGRVAEVAARFTLDAMPGKQLSIDADLNAGVIDQEQAQKQRVKIIAEADFYGAMDGASKFVRGDAIAGIVIIIVNMIGGFLVGGLVKGMGFQEIVQVYMTLTIGDGLVTQVPALLISVGAGIIVTRSSSKENLGILFRQQLFNNPRVLNVTGWILIILGLVPGMPFSVMFPIAMTLFLYAYALRKQARESMQEEEMTIEEQSKTSEMEKALFVDQMEIELGNNLTIFADASHGGELLRRISMIRRQVASSLGIVIPSIRIVDNKLLNPDSYVIKIKGNEVASGTLRLASYLAINPGNIHSSLQGIETIEPVFGLSALWISANQKEQAEKLGYTVVDPLTVLTTHLTEVIQTHAHELLNRQEVSRLVNSARIYASAVIDELLPHRLTLGHILKVLQNLLRERISIRDIGSILEILADHAAMTTDVDVLTEYVRQGLARSLSKQYVSDDKSLHVITLDPKVEQMIMESLQSNEFGKQLVLHPTTSYKLVDAIEHLMSGAAEKRVQPVLLTAAPIRMYVKKLVERNFPRLPTLSYQEVVPDIPIIQVGTVNSDILTR